MKKTAFALFLFVGASFSSCEPEDDTEMKFNCVSGNCTENTDGTYPTLLACEDACGGDVAYGCQNGNCVAMEGGTYETLALCQAACDESENPEPCSGSFESPLISATGSCMCDGESAAIFASGGWSVVSSYVGSSGTHQFSVDAFTENCSTCPNLILTQQQNPDAFYVSVSGSGSWAGSVFTFNAVVQTQEDYELGGSDTYQVSGWVNCQE